MATDEIGGVDDGTGEWTQEPLFEMGSTEPVAVLVTTNYTKFDLATIGRDCGFCDEKVTDAQYPDAYFEMTTWVHGPKKNGDTFRNYTGGVAHKECIENAARGIAPNQPSLFDE